MRARIVTLPAHAARSGFGPSVPTRGSVSVSLFDMLFLQLCLVLGEGDVLVVVVVK